MASAKLYRLGGLSVIFGAVLFIIGTVIRIPSGDGMTNMVLATGWFFYGPAAMLMGLGLPAVYLRQAHVTGRLGLIGFVGTTLHLLILGVFAGLLHALILPSLARQVPNLTQPHGYAFFMLGGALLGLVGTVALGIATIRAAVLPRAAGAALVVGGLGEFLGHNQRLFIEDIGFMVLVAALGWLALSVLPTVPARLATTLEGSAAANKAARDAALLGDAPAPSGGISGEAIREQA